MAIGYGPVGRGRVASGSVHRKPWKWNAEELGINGMGLTLRALKEEEERVYNGAHRQTVIGKAPADPRLSRFHEIEVVFRGVNHEIVQRVEEHAYFPTAGFTLKFHQWDYRDLGLGAPYSDAEKLYSSTPSAASCALWFVSKRGISNESGDGPFLYVEETLTTSGISWNYAEGAVLFATPLAASSNVRAYYVWRPRLQIKEHNIQPHTGQKHLFNRYDVTVVCRQL